MQDFQLHFKTSENKYNLKMFVKGGELTKTISIAVRRVMTAKVRWRFCGFENPMPIEGRDTLALMSAMRYRNALKRCGLEAGNGGLGSAFRDFG